LNNIDESSYLIIFDELDEDYKHTESTGQYGEYSSLLTSLFKAVQDIKAIFPTHTYKILPIVFLRNDIYEIMLDADKTKWSDLAIELDWNRYKIKELLAFRIARAIDPQALAGSFQQVWDQVFYPTAIRYGQQDDKKMSTFDFITRSTLSRPRDYVRYLRAAAELALAQGNPKISSTVIKKAEGTFSNYLRSELEDEIHSVIPEIKQVLDIIAHMRQQVFSFEQFSTAYQKEVDRGLIENRGAEFILKVLFHFSVVGNQTRVQHLQVFSYLNKEARFNSNDKICVHRGLFKSLQIF
jgi:hypothetical protein